ncbi:hypothetical protein Tco_0595142 [Tanacetum coccineum]
MVANRGPHGTDGGDNAGRWRYLTVGYISSWFFKYHSSLNMHAHLSGRQSGGAHQGYLVVVFRCMSLNDFLLFDPFLKALTATEARTSSVSSSYPGISPFFLRQTKIHDVFNSSISSGNLYNHNCGVLASPGLVGTLDGGLFLSRLGGHLRNSIVSNMKWKLNGIV